MSNASLFCGTLEPTRMRWECGQVRVTRLRKGSNCAGVQRCQVCAPINMDDDRHEESNTLCTNIRKHNFTLQPHFEKERHNNPHRVRLVDRGHELTNKNIIFLLQGKDRTVTLQKW